MFWKIRSSSLRPPKDVFSPAAAENARRLHSEAGREGFVEGFLRACVERTVRIGMWSDANGGSRLIYRTRLCGAIGHEGGVLPKKGIIDSFPFCRRWWHFRSTNETGRCKFHEWTSQEALTGIAAPLFGDEGESAGA